MRGFVASLMILVLVPAARGQSAQPTPAQTIRALQESVKLHPTDPAIRLQLGLAFYAVGDLADAEEELREAASRSPDSATVHNSLGIVLYESGNAGEAVEEFRIALRLAPGDPNAHFNLGAALAANGEAVAGNRELDSAAHLAPAATTLTRIVRAPQVASAAGTGSIPGSASIPASASIKVDVRQVLVPVVIKDRDGHYVTGLSRRDFKVLEDGVEQTITAFSVERSGIPEPGAVSQQRPSTLAAPPAEGATRPARRTYLICIDTLHASFNNFVSVRDALTRLFQRENSEDSQYVVVALGNSADVVLNTTRDQNAVLSALKSKSFQKIFLEGQVGGLKADLERYRRDLNETRIRCDMAAKTGDVKQQMECQVGKERVPREAEGIAELDRTLTIGFLRQFRNLVAQLATARDRRTIVFISDGFQIAPGRQAYELLTAFFPDIRGYSLRSGARLQDEFDPIMKLASRNNITIDTIDSRGLYGIGTFDASNQGSTITVSSAVDRVDHDIEFTNNSTLSELAKATGGTAFYNSNDLLNGLERAFADGRDYYLLGYVSGNAAQDGKFRAITVQIGRRDVVINAKRGYWAEASTQ